MQLAIRVRPKANRSAVEVDGDRVTVRVTAAPENGKANEAVVALLAKKLGVAKRRVSILRGQKAPDKIVQIDDLTLDQVFDSLTSERS